MQTALVCFELIARINQIDVDLRTVTREYGITDGEVPKEHSSHAKNLGFRARVKQMPLTALLATYPVPAMVVFNDQATGSSSR
jgi:subfamily B ATP-binding cassette protein HlyB/CyaB